MANRETILDTFLAPWQQTIRDFTGVTGERSGLNNGPIVEAVPQYNVTPSEKVQQGVTAKNTDADGEPVVTNKNPDLDSARIYISQRARDIDSEEYFSLAEGQVGFVEQSSAIAIKADSVRLIGRQGIKLVTGDSYSGGSGFWIGDNTQGIDLIAGNDDEDLQPLVKGNDLAKVLDRIINLLTELEGAINATTAFAIAAAIPIYPPVPAALALLKFEQQSMKSFNIRATTLKLDYSATNPIAFSNFRSKYNTTN